MEEEGEEPEPTPSTSVADDVAADTVDITSSPVPSSSPTRSITDDELLCHLCSKSFSTIAAKRRHMVVHLGTRNKYTCETCGAAFQRKNNLKDHIRIHSSDKPYKCTFCPNSYKRILSLKRHLAIHSGVKPFVCKECGKSFALHVYLQGHRKRVHPEDALYCCQLCPAKFRMRKTLNIHYALHDDNATEEMIRLAQEKEPYKHHDKGHFECSKCDKVYVQYGTFKNHLKMHLDKNHPCEYCGKSFLYKSMLKKHMQLHTGEKTHSCPTCDRKFRSASYLKYHVLGHTGERPYKCDHCVMAFRCRGGLRVHMRRHTGDKPFQCPMCPRKFASSSGRCTHIRSHTGVKPYVCQQCLRCFRLPTGLKKHLRCHEKKHMLEMEKRDQEQRRLELAMSISMQAAEDPLAAIGSSDTDEADETAETVAQEEESSRVPPQKIEGAEENIMVL